MTNYLVYKLKQIRFTSILMSYITNLIIKKKAFMETQKMHLISLKVEI